MPWSPESPNGTFAPVVIGGGAQTLVALGDSIVAAGDTLTGSSLTRYDSYPFWLSLLSGGRIRYVRNAGIGGNTLADMLARFDTAVTPYAPTMVSVMAGTNDITGGVTDAAYHAYSRTFVAKCRAIGALPVIFGSPPVNSFSTAQKQQLLRLRIWLSRYCASQGIPFIDAFGAVADPASAASYLAANTVDGGTHPTDLGHYLIGLAAWNQLKNGFAPTAQTVLAATNLDPDNLLANGLFLTGGGTADSWSFNWGPSGGSYGASQPAVASFPGGKAQRLTLTGTTAAQAQLHQSVSSGFSVGDVVSLAMIVSAAGIAAPGGGLSFTGSGVSWAWKVTGAASAAASITNAVLHSPDMVIPAGTTALDVLISAWTTANPTTGTCDFGAATLYNHTTGLAVPITV